MENGSAACCCDSHLHYLVQNTHPVTHKGLKLACNINTVVMSGWVNNWVLEFILLREKLGTITLPLKPEIGAENT
jgi:hypothetical protein